MTLEIDTAAPVLDKGKQKDTTSSGKEEQKIDSLPWVEKYRPVTIDDLISHKEILTTINKFLDQDRLPHLLLYGPPGTGKTSTILAVARRLYGKSYKSMILELNASDSRGIDVIRDQIITFASTRNMFSSGFKLVVLDEADSMTAVAMAALRRVMEKYTKNVRFCIICNYVSKVIPAIQSRCTRFRFAPLARSQIEPRIRSIAGKENLLLTEDGTKAVLNLSKGDMRRALNILQAVKSGYGEATEEHVYACTGQPTPSEIEQVFRWLLEETFDDAYQKIQVMKELKGLALQDLVTEIYQFIRFTEFPRGMKVFLIQEIAKLEERLNSGCDDKIQLSALVAAFQAGKEMATRIKGDMSGFKFNFMNDVPEVVVEEEASNTSDRTKGEYTRAALFESAIDYTTAVYRADPVRLQSECEDVVLFRRNLSDIRFEIAQNDALIVDRTLEAAVASSSDLIPGVYEGGFKTWECSLDLVTYLSNIRESCGAFEGLNVLELGCGSALPGIYCLLNTDASRVDFQDYNSDVLSMVTLPNIVINWMSRQKEQIESDLTNDMEFEVLECENIFESVQSMGCMWSGDWNSFHEASIEANQEPTKYQLIISAETIYHEESYPKLVNLLENCLDVERGIALFACKSHYFGCGGNSLSFLHFLSTHSQLECRIVAQVQNGQSLARQILEIRHRQ